MMIEPKYDSLMDGAMDFQKATAMHIFQLLTDESRKNRRVLLADEVGLGKTFVARNVVSLIREYQREKGDNYYRVVYVCSNINIARQNIGKLGIKIPTEIKSSNEASNSRLSMQHLAIEKNNSDAEEYRKKTGNMPEIIIPLTPSTSFDYRSSTGIASERALICVLLEYLDEFKETWQKKRLEKFFMCGVTNVDTWKGYLKKYRSDIKVLREGYLKDIETELRNRGAKEISELSAMANAEVRIEGKEKSVLISSIRKIFALISVDKLDPDLVIMDEFQRFKDLLVGDNEQSLLARQLFSNAETKVLLLSATPYKLYTPLDERMNTGKDEHFNDFRDLMKFLHEGDKKRWETFEKEWEEYSKDLPGISDKPFDVILQDKIHAEDALYGVMSRTERINDRAVRTLRERLRVTKEDITSYFQARELLDSINEAATSGSGFRTMPLDYVKSSPYLMTFMDRYKLKEFIEDNRDKIGKKTWNLLYLPKKKIDGYYEVSSANARLRYLEDYLFKTYNAQKLLWVPASRPFYRTHGVYMGSEGFSKSLVFSSWAMVPRMISCMVSYEAERLQMKEMWALNKRPGKYFKTEDKSTSNRYGANRITQLKFKGGENPICYVCEYLANIYDPEEYIGQDIREIKRKITPQIREKVDGIVSKYGIPIKKNTRIADLTKLMQFIDSIDEEGNGDEKLLPESIGFDFVENLVNAAIGSPAVCAFRLHKDKQLAGRIAQFFEKLFNRADPALIVDISIRRKDGYIENVLAYCVEGNLQAVLQEYDHLLEGDWDEVLDIGPLDVNQLKVELQNGDNDVESRSMRNWIAIPFTNAKMEDNAVAHTTALRTAFNSPFRPFVLTTTSVGQEGLDFHWYARRLIHWNLPSNPVDMEQREGRVNRYKCLSIRQRLGAQYPHLPTWDDIFEKAKEDYKQNYSDMVPYWCLPPEFPQDQLIERIILEYPLSQESGRYDRQMKILYYYRLTMGQPQQEELLERLSASGLTPEQIRELLIDICPFDRCKD